MAAWKDFFNQSIQEEFKTTFALAALKYVRSKKYGNYECLDEVIDTLFDLELFEFLALNLEDCDNDLDITCLYKSLNLANVDCGNITDPACVEEDSSTVDIAALDESVTTDQDVPIVIDVVANDSSTECDLDYTTITITSAPSNGMTSINTVTGEITYTPDGGWFGVDTFTYEICCGSPYNSSCDTAVVTITVCGEPVLDITVTNKNGSPFLVNVDTGTLAYNDNDPFDFTRQINWKFWEDDLVTPAVLFETGDMALSDDISLLLAGLIAGNGLAFTVNSTIYAFFLANGFAPTDTYLYGIQAELTNNCGLSVESNTVYSNAYVTDVVTAASTLVAEDPEAIELQDNGSDRSTVGAIGHLATTEHEWTIAEAGGPDFLVITGLAGSTTLTLSDLAYAPYVSGTGDSVYIDKKGIAEFVRFEVGFTEDADVTVASPLTLSALGQAANLNAPVVAGNSTTGMEYDVTHVVTDTTDGLASVNVDTQLIPLFWRMVGDNHYRGELTVGVPVADPIPGACETLATGGVYYSDVRGSSDGIANAGVVLNQLNNRFEVISITVDGVTSTPFDVFELPLMGPADSVGFAETMLSSYGFDQWKFNSDLQSYFSGSCGSLPSPVPATSYDFRCAYYITEGWTTHTITDVQIKFTLFTNVGAVPAGTAEVHTRFNKQFIV